MHSSIAPSSLHVASSSSSRAGAVGSAPAAPGASAALDRTRRLLPPRWIDALRDDTGSATAEYAIATMAAVGFAGVLVVILRSDDVHAALATIIRNALSIGG